MPLASRHRPRPLRFARYRLARRRRSLTPPAADAGELDPAAAGWRATIDAAIALVRAGRFAEADRVIERGLAAFPGDPGLLVEHALSAHWRGLHREAIVRFERALAAAPQEVICHFSLATDLRAIGETDAAGRVLAVARQRFPKDSSVIAEAARLAESDSRFADALALWAPLLRRHDPHPDWLRGHAHALVLLGRFMEAEAALARALARHPDFQALLAVEGILASSREDWPKAVELWAAYRRRFPHDRTGWEHYGRAVQGAALKDTDDRLAARGAMARVAQVAPLTAPLEIDVVDDATVRQLLLGFESLGDSCEFGLVQRRWAAEPLGLLRWNDVQLDNLLAALSHRFEGMGEVENTEMPVIDNREFTIKDKRWDLWMHTFLFEGQADPATLFPKMRRRVVFLRDKLVEDLTAADKIFVYKAPTLRAAELTDLHAALEAYGPVKLLAVLPVGAAGDFRGSAGEIAEVGQRCWVGYISRLGVAEDNHWDIAFDDWVGICRKVAGAAGSSEVRSPAPPPAA